MTVILTLFILYIFSRADPALDVNAERSESSSRHGLRVVFLVATAVAVAIRTRTALGAITVTVGRVPWFWEDRGWLWCMGISITAACLYRLLTSRERGEQELPESVEESGAEDRGEAGPDDVGA